MQKPICQQYCHMIVKFIIEGLSSYYVQLKFEKSKRNSTTLHFLLGPTFFPHIFKENCVLTAKISFVLQTTKHLVEVSCLHLLHYHATLSHFKVGIFQILHSFCCSQWRGKDTQIKLYQSSLLLRRFKHIHREKCLNWYTVFPTSFINSTLFQVFWQFRHMSPKVC